MRAIDGDKIITAQLYDDEYEEFTEKKMSIIDFINAYTDEGVNEADVVEQTKLISCSEQNPNRKVIYLDDAIDAVAEGLKRTFVEYRDVAEKMLNKVPSAQPEQRWIPCNEKLPEEKKDVLIAFKHNMAVGFWEDILDNGEPVWYANSGDGWMTDTANVDSDGIPLAWMPLPEPYEGKKE